MKKLGLILAMFVALQVEARVPGWHLETVMGYMIDRNGIAFQVYDGGCTNLEDFYLRVETDNSGQALLSLYRKNIDPCKAFFPYGRAIRFDYNAIGISKNQAFKISNPINPGFIRY